MNNYEKLAQAIILYQEKIIGPLAWNEADKVSELNASKGSVKISGEGKKVLTELVSQYENLFGRASVEACKDAIRPLLSEIEDLELPQILL